MKLKSEKEIKKLVNFAMKNGPITYHISKAKLGKNGPNFFHK